MESDEFPLKNLYLNQYSFILNFLQALFKDFAAVSMKTAC